MSRFHVDRLVKLRCRGDPAALPFGCCSNVRRIGSSAPATTSCGRARRQLRFARASPVRSARAFGEPPSRWRIGAASYRIGPAGAVHFRPPRLDLLRSREAIHEPDREMIHHHVARRRDRLDRAKRSRRRRARQPDHHQRRGVDDDPDAALAARARLVGQMAMWELAEQGGFRYDLAAERGPSSVGQMRGWLDEVGPGSSTSPDAWTRRSSSTSPS